MNLYIFSEQGYMLFVPGLGTWRLYPVNLSDDTAYDATGAWVVAGISEIPIPGAVWLLGSGLVGSIAIRKKLKK